MSIRDWLIVVGLVILLGVIVDLIRRFLQRGKLRIAIDKKYADLPDADLGAELPNGGARVVTRDSHDCDPSFSEPSISEPSATSAAAVQRPTAEPETKKRVIIDDALMASPALAGEREESNEWDVDPLLGSDRNSDTEVDLLLEREFKGVGQGADHWDESPVSPSFESRAVETPDVEIEAAIKPAIRAETLAEADKPLVSEDAAAIENADTSAEAAAEIVARTAAQTPSEPSVIEPVTAPLEAPTEAQIEQSVKEAVAQESGLDLVDPLSAGVQSGSPTVGLVDDDILDLERPVHELLVRQQTETTASAVDELSPAAETPTADLRVGPVSESDLSEENDKAVAAKKAPVKRAKASKKASRKRAEPRAEEQPSFFDLHPDLAPEVEVEVPAAKPKSRRRRKKVKQSEPETAPQPEAAVEPQVLIVNVQAKREPFAGPLLFKLVSACGLEFGSEMSIYHRYEGDDGQGALQFSMANAIAPGTFDPANADDFSTPAITFFLQLADPTDRMNAFECMLATAQCVADNLHGELKDENRSSLRTQTIEHYRQKVREYERKQLTRRV